MIAKTKSLRSSGRNGCCELGLIFHVPQAIKVRNLTPKRLGNDYIQAFADCGLRKSWSRCNDASNPRLQSVSPSCLPDNSISLKPKNKFTDYLKNYVKEQNFVTAVKAKNPLVTNEQKAVKKVTRRPKGSLRLGRQKTTAVNRSRPARFLSQEDIENHLGSKEKPIKVVGNKDDMRLLLENNHSKLVESFENDKICRIYDITYNKPGIIKKNDWTWLSPDHSPRTVQFKD